MNNCKVCNVIVYLLTTFQSRASYVKIDQVYLPDELKENFLEKKHLS